MARQIPNVKSCGELRVEWLISVHTTQSSTVRTVLLHVWISKRHSAVVVHLVLFITGLGRSSGTPVTTLLQQLLLFNSVVACCSVLLAQPNLYIYIWYPGTWYHTAKVHRPPQTPISGSICVIRGRYCSSLIYGTLLNIVSARSIMQ